MPLRSDDPLRKITLNLYEADCVWLEQTYGRGWTERIRQHIQHTVRERQRADKITSQRPLDTPPRHTLGDLTDE